MPTAGKNFANRMSYSKGTVFGWHLHELLSLCLHLYTSDFRLNIGLKLGGAG